MTNADKLRLIGDAISKHQAEGGGAGHAWDIAIFDAGYAAALAVAICECEKLEITTNMCAARIRKLGAK